MSVFGGTRGGGVDARLVALTLAAGAVVGVTWARFPPAAEPPFDLSVLSAPLPAKILAALEAVFGLAAMNLAALGLGSILGRRLPAPWPGGWRLLTRLGLGFGGLAYAVFGLAPLHLLNRPALALVILLPAAAGGVEAVRLARSGSGRWRRRAWWGLGGLVALAGPVLAAFVPDYGWDAFVYHLAVPERYLFVNGIWASPDSVYSAFPLTVQMLYLPALAFDLAPVTKLLHLEFGVLSILAVALLARRVSTRAAALAVVILAADPLLFWEMGVAYADLAACFYALLAAGAVAAWRGGERWGLILAGVFAGAAVAVHYRMAVVLAAVLVAACWPPWPRGGRRAAGAAMLLLVAALAVVSPWLVRNAVVFGNPVAPALQGLFHDPGEEYFDPIAVEQSLELAMRRGPGREALEFATLPWGLTAGTRPGGSPLYSFRLGCLYLIGLLACLLRRGRPGHLERTLLGVAGVAAVLWFWSGTQEARYALPMALLVAAPAGAALDALLPRRGRWGWPLLAILGLAVAHGQWDSARLLPWRWGYALGTLPVAGFEAQEPALVAGARLRDRLEEADRLQLLFEGRAYFFRGLDYLPYHVNEGAPVLQVARRAADPAALRQELARRDVTHVLVNLEAMDAYPTVLVPGYGAEEDAATRRKIFAFLRRDTEPFLRERHVVVRRLRQDGRAPNEARPNVLVLTIDTLRADHVGRSVAGNEVMPYLDELLGRGVRFTRASAPVPRTTQALASLLTGVYPHTHGVRTLYDSLAGGVRSVAESARQGGYRTIAVVSNHVLTPERGLGRGFDVYDAADDARGAAATNRAALAALGARQVDQPVFLWVHYIDPHVPYLPPPDLARAFDPPYRGRYRLGFGQAAGGIGDQAYPVDLPKAEAVYRNPLPAEVNDHIRRLYAADARSADDAARVLVGALEADSHRPWLIVVTADHGESLGEHDYFWDHGDYVYEPGLRVPLGIVSPDGAGAGRVVETPVSLVDVAPTLLELIGLPGSGHDFEGRSLAGVLGGGDLPSTPVFAESGRSFFPALVRRRVDHGLAGGFRAVVDGDRKLIWTPGLPREQAYELYDLAADPGEIHDLSAARPQEVERLAALLEAWLRPVDEPPAPSPEDARRLRALGYLE